MVKQIDILDINGESCGYLLPHPTGNGFVGRFVGCNKHGHDMSDQVVDFFGLNEHDAKFFFSLRIEDEYKITGQLLMVPPTMFHWSLLRDGNGFFIAVPYGTPEQDDILLSHREAHELQLISERANKVRSVFGPRMNGCTLEQVWQLEERMNEFV